ncbi:Cro/CI family transcriptional regulator [Butyrivibrio virus Arian]|nr:Cro/CI family transcriptional regulator [Butyrivibrio virus Arian]
MQALANGGKRTALKVFRVSRNMTQDDIAGATGVSRSTYALIEEGARGGRAKFWEALQNAFDLPDGEMYGLMKCNKQ